MSNDFDDYLNKQLARQEETNRTLTEARQRLGWGAVISIAEEAICLLVDKSKIAKPTAGFIKASTRIIAGLAKSWFGF